MPASRREGETAEMLKVVTIGVYGYRAEDFFGALQRAGVQLLCADRFR